jgi:hypothetical protein
MRSLLAILSFMLICVSAKSQDWEPGYIYDTTGVKQTGFIRFAEKSPIKDEAAIVFKQAKNSPESYFTASAIKSFVMSRDSFVVATQPNNAAWNDYYNFVQVLFDENELKLYAFYGEPSGTASNEGSRSHFSLGLGFGGGFGGYGSHFGGGVGAGFAIPLGGSNRSYPAGTQFYYGINTSHMKPLNNQNFADIMSQILGDEPKIVDRLHAGKYDTGNMDKLLRDYYKEQSKHPVAAAQ